MCNQEQYNRNLAEQKAYRYPHIHNLIVRITDAGLDYRKAPNDRARLLAEDDLREAIKNYHDFLFAPKPVEYNREADLIEEARGDL